MTIWETNNEKSCRLLMSGKVCSFWQVTTGSAPYPTPIWCETLFTRIQEKRAFLRPVGIAIDEGWYPKTCYVKFIPVLRCMLLWHCPCPTISWFLLQRIVPWNALMRLLPVVQQQLSENPSKILQRRTIITQATHLICGHYHLCYPPKRPWTRSVSFGMPPFNKYDHRMIL